MSFPSFDPSQAPPVAFAENGAAALPQGQPLPAMQAPLQMQPQPPQVPEGPTPFQGQAGLEPAAAAGPAGAPDSKTTLW